MTRIATVQSVSFYGEPYEKFTALAEFKSTIRFGPPEKDD